MEIISLPLCLPLVIRLLSAFQCSFRVLDLFFIFKFLYVLICSHPHHVLGYKRQQNKTKQNRIREERREQTFIVYANGVRPYRNISWAELASGRQREHTGNCTRSITLPLQPTRRKGKKERKTKQKETTNSPYFSRDAHIRGPLDRYAVRIVP